MKIEINVGELKEVLEARDAADALSKTKSAAAERAPLMFRGIIKSLSDIQFAQEAVKRENTAQSRHDTLPHTAQEFLDWAVMRGYATILEN